MHETWRRHYHHSTPDEVEQNNTNSEMNSPESNIIESSTTHMHESTNEELEHAFVQFSQGRKYIQIADSASQTKPSKQE